MMPLSEVQKALALKALRNYFREELWMIKGYIEFTKEYGIVLIRAANYAAAICDIVGRMQNWVIEYVKKMFNIELTISEASELVKLALLQVNFTPSDHTLVDVMNVCNKKPGSQEFIDAVSKLIGK